MNVFIVENSEAVGECLQSILSDIPGITVIGHAADEADAIEHIDALLPDVVIHDLGLQSGAGIGVLEHTKKRHAAIKIIVFTRYTDKFYVERCKRAGADYFFDKSFQFTQLREILWKWAHTDRLDNKFRSGNKFDALQIAGV